MPRAFTANKSKKYAPKQLWEKAPQTEIRSYFDVMLDKKYFYSNKPYLAKLVSASHAAALLDIRAGDALRLFKQYDVLPKLKRKRSYMYLVKDIVDLGQKIGKPFIIPDGIFNYPRVVYVGDGLQKTAKLRHKLPTKYYNSVFEMLCDAGIPIQNLVFSASMLKYLEPAFLLQVAKLFKKYNKFINDSNEYKRVILCTKIGDREYAESLVKKYNDKYSGVFITIDQDHLHHLRLIDHNLNMKKKDDDTDV